MELVWNWFGTGSGLEYGQACNWSVDRMRHGTLALRSFSESRSQLPRSRRGRAEPEAEIIVTLRGILWRLAKLSEFVVRVQNTASASEAFGQP